MPKNEAAASGGEAAAKKAKRKERRKGKEAGAGKAGKDKAKNPLVREARTRYEADLRKQGVAEDQIKGKVRAHLKDVVKPAMSEAKEGAKSKDLKGGERKKFIHDAVRAKLGFQA
jgi:hypothetical protein